MNKRIPLAVLTAVMVGTVGTAVPAVAAPAPKMTRHPVTQPTLVHPNGTSWTGTR